MKNLLVELGLKRAPDTARQASASSPAGGAPNRRAQAAGSPAPESVDEPTAPGAASPTTTANAVPASGPRPVSVTPPDPGAAVRRAEAPDTAAPPRPAITPPPDETDARDVDVMTTFVDRLLSTIEQLAPDAEADATREFQSQLEEYRHVVLDRSRRLEVPRVTEACIVACERYFQLSRQYYLNRENELAEVITILRDAAQLTVGDSSEFNEQLMATSERFHGLIHLEDVREIKKRIVAEVSTLRKVVQEKQDRDKRAYTQLVTRVETLQAKLNEVESEVTLDPLTQIGNRRRFQATLSRWVETARKTGSPLSLAMLDVDNFKQINDTHGHPIGDRVLVCTAQSLTQGLRQTDFVARYGGEEFVVLLSNASANQVETRMQALVEGIAETTFDYDILGRKQTIRFTISCGLTDFQPADTEEDLLRRADEALYEAKRRGKNRVIIKRASAISSLLSWG